MVTGQKQDAQIKLDALTPIEMEEKAELAGISKAKMPAMPMFLLAIAAGAFIGLGGMYYCIIAADPNLGFAAKKMVGGIAFCLGLALVLVAGAELFTGNSLMIMARLSGRITTPQILRNWIIVWVGNLVGSVVIVFIAFMAHEYTLNGNGVETVMLKIGIAKVSLDSTTIFFKAIMCNLMVCLAVWLAYSCRTVADKIIAIILPISGFVAAGFEHCVANMYFLPFAYLLKETGNVPEGMDVSALSIASIAHNILFATAGNIVGGGLFVGALYWAIYRKGMGGTAAAASKQEKTSAASGQVAAQQ